VHKPPSYVLRDLRLRGSRNLRGEVVRLVRRPVVPGRPDLLVADGEGALLQHQPQIDDEEDPECTE
jgi:hypothetical protein